MDYLLPSDILKDVFNITESYKLKIEIDNINNRNIKLFKIYNQYNHILCKSYIIFDKLVNNSIYTIENNDTETITIFQDHKFPIFELSYNYIIPNNMIPQPIDNKWKIIVYEDGIKNYDMFIYIGYDELYMLLRTLNIDANILKHVMYIHKINIIKNRYSKYTNPNDKMEILKNSILKKRNQYNNMIIDYCNLNKKLKHI